MIPQYIGINRVSAQEVEEIELVSVWNIDLRKIGLALVLGQCEHSLCISGQKNADMSWKRNTFEIMINAVYSHQTTHSDFFQAP